MLFSLVYPEYCNQKDMNNIFYSISYTKSSKSSGYFTPISHLSLDAIFSLNQNLDRNVQLKK